MAIAVAIVISAILFLIDRNHVWRQVWKITKWTVLVVVVLAVVGFGGFYWYATWSDARDAREREAREKAAQAVADKAIADRWADLAPLQKELCGDKFIAVYSGQYGTFPVGGEVACAENNRGDTPVDKALFVTAPGCTLLRNKFPEFACHLAPWDIKWDVSPATPRKTSKPERRLRCKYDGVELTDSVLGNLKTGEVQMNEIVTLLENNGIGNIRVRTKAGKVGWANDGNFEVVDQ